MPYCHRPVLVRVRLRVHCMVHSGCTSLLTCCAIVLACTACAYLLCALTGTISHHAAAVNQGPHQVLVACGLRALVR